MCVSFGGRRTAVTVVLTVLLAVVASLPVRALADAGSGSRAVSATAGPVVRAMAAPDRPNSFAAVRGATPVRYDRWIPERLATAGDEDWYRFTISAPTTVSVTLGGLPADYSLTVFDAVGRTVGRSFKAGTAFERVVVAVRPGSYYARVDVTKGFSATKDYVIRFRGHAATVVPLSWHTYTSNGQVMIAVELYNATDRWRRIDGVGFLTYDRNGRILTRELIALSMTQIGPRRYGYLSGGGLLGVPADMVGARATVQSLEVTPDVNYGLSVTPTPGQGAGSVHTGTVTTRSTVPTDDVSVDVGYFDAFGQLFLADGGYIGAMAPRSTAPYRVQMTTRLWTTRAPHSIITIVNVPHRSTPANPPVPD